MYILEVEVENTHFIDFLNKESTPVDINKYIFSSYVLASDIISNYITFYIKKNAMLEMVEAGFLRIEELHDFNSFLPVEKIHEIRMSIYHYLLEFLKENNRFHLDGFIEFRIRKEIMDLYHLLDEHYDFFLEAMLNGDDIDIFLDMLNSQVPLEKELFVIFESNGYITLKGEKNIYISGEIDSDDVLSHVMIVAPHLVHVFDPFHKLAKDIVILMKRIFREKVNFYEKEYTGN